MRTNEVKEAALLLARLDNIRDWQVMVENDAKPHWILDRISSSAEPNTKALTVYGDSGADDEIILTPDELLEWLTTLQLATVQKLHKLGVEL